MNISELIQEVHLGMSPYLNISHIDIYFSIDLEKNRSPLKINSSLPFNMRIMIAYTSQFDNFTTTFYDREPKPKSIKEIISKILKTAKEQKVPLRTAKKPKDDITNVTVS